MKLIINNGGDTVFWKKKKDPEEIPQVDLEEQFLKELNATSLENREVEKDEEDLEMTKLHTGVVIPEEVLEESEVLAPSDEAVEIEEEPVETVPEEESIIEPQHSALEETAYIDTKLVAEEYLETGEEEVIAEEYLEEEPPVTVAAPKKKTSTISKVFGCFGNLLFIVFIVLMISVVSINAISFVRNEEPSFMGYRMYIIGEDSMSPTIKRNDAVIIKQTPSENLKVGDLITYESKTGKSVITGWVTKILDNDRFEVKKKMNNDQSVIIEGIAVTGIASFRIANMGDFIEFISHPLGIGLVIVVGILIYLIMWLLGRRRELQR